MRQKHKLCLIVAAALAALVGIVWAGGGIALYRGSPPIFPGISAGRSTAMNVGIGMVVAGGCLIAAAASAFLRHRIAWPLGAASAAVFAVDGFVSNYLLFGAIRPKHTLTDVAIAAVILGLLAGGRRALSASREIG
jgi:hypothetical protein